MQIKKPTAGSIPIFFFITATVFPLSKAVAAAAAGLPGKAATVLPISAAGEQDTRPLTDIHGSVCVSQCNGVVQRTENTGHKNDEKDQQNELRQGTGGRWSRELML